MKILLAIDGSEYSRKTIDFLSKFPFAHPPEVHVIHVSFIPDLHFLGDTVLGDASGGDFDQMVGSIRKEAEQLVKAAEKNCSTWAESVSTHVLEGHPSKLILKTAETENVDLIVIGSRGLGAINRFLLGSVSEKVATYAKCSVLVVRTPIHSEISNTQTILLADDASNHATHAIETFASFPLGPERKVSLLGMLETSSSPGLLEVIENNPYWKDYAIELRDHLEMAQKTLSTTKAQISTRLCKSLNFAQEILESAERENADLIVMGSAGKSAWERLLLGSISTKVLRHASCSVWIERIPNDPEE